MAAVRIVDLIIGTHNGSDAGTHSVCKGPHVKFMHGGIINIGGEGGRNIPAIAFCFSYLTKVLLLIIISNKRVL